LTWLFWQISKLSLALSKLEKKGIEALDATSLKGITQASIINLLRDR